MNKRQLSFFGVERLQTLLGGVPYRGLFLALICALSAELLLFGFLDNVGALAPFARMAVVFLSIYTIHRFGRLAQPSYRPNIKDLITLVSIVAGSIVIVAIGRSIGSSLYASAQASSVLRGLSGETFFFAIPFAAGALMLQAMMGMQYGLIFAFIIALIVGVYFPQEPILFSYAFVTSLVGCLSLIRPRSRSAYLKAGLNIALVAVPFALASIFIQGELFLLDGVLRILAALLGGVLCYVVGSAIVPIVEHLGGYVTDMRLLEMATLDHPLLKDLSVQAPGTWNHSMVMGMMVESAAEVIGANSVLARVGAYFHDVGKMKKPIYFVENQGGVENRHGKLSTSMSALIIKSHIKDGIELLRKYKVPKVIEDMIPQHHGTSMIEFFYHKACKEAIETGGDPSDVDTSLYSYPGPKPQTKEAAILMLADGIEAAVRTISEPTHDRIQGLVQKMINKVFRSGQLNECDMTLRDLHQIAAVFTRVLTAIYHQRIAYAEPAEKGGEKAAPRSAAAVQEASKDESKTKETKEMGDPGSDKGARTVEQNGNKKNDPDDLKRLGMEVDS